MDSKPTLLIIRGAPGAGKSTIARALINSVLFDAYVEADSYFMRDGKYEFSISHIGEAHDYCFNEAKELMKRGRSVIISNTNTRKKDYQKYLDLAEKYGYNIQVMTLQGPWKSEHDVPEITVEKMKARLANLLIEESKSVAD